MKQDIIVKSNVLLQQPLYKTSTELKIFSLVLLKVRENPENEVFSLNISDLMDNFEGSKDNYTFLKNTAKKMFGVIDLNPSEKGFDLNVIFVKINTKQEGIITFKLNLEIKPYILNLTNNFTKYYFENIARLKSGFSIRIYELLKQYESIGKRNVPIKELRHFLNISDEKFTRYNDFKRKAILVAQKELKEKTDISFEFEEIKTGRKITDIIFFIFKNKKTTPINSSKVEDIKIEKIELEEEPPESHQLEYEKLMSLGVSKSQALKLCKNHTEEKINNNIRYIEKEQEKGRKKDNIAGFLVSAIENDYYNQTQLKIDDVSLKKDEERRKKEHQQTIIDRQEKERVAKEKEVKRQQIEQFLEDIDDNDFSDLQENFIAEHVKDTFMMKYVKNNELDLSSSIIKMNFYNFIYTTCIKGLQDLDKSI